MPNKRYIKIIVFLSCAICLSSCSTFAPAPTITPTLVPTLTSTPIPTETPIPTSTNTPQPPTPTVDIISALIPSGIPDAEWNGIPIMPEAINGEGDDKGYRFTIATTPEEVQEYYEKAFSKLGFNLFAIGEGEGKNTVLLIFMKDVEIVSVSIIPTPDVLIVMLVK